jgi:hypothetical protein
MTLMPRAVSRSVRQVTLVVAVAVAAAWPGLGCSESPEFVGPAPSPDGVMFVEEVYPLLLRDCAFSNCHGAQERFLQVLGPGRTRLAEETGQDDEMMLTEVQHSYDRARTMLATADNPADSLLLVKPLELEQGGQTHRGIDPYGRNVFASKSAIGYRTLMRWAKSSGSSPQQDHVDAANTAAAAAVANWLGGGS